MKYVYILMLAMSCLSLSCSDSFDYYYNRAKAKELEFLTRNGYTNRSRNCCEQGWYQYFLIKGDTDSVKEYIDNKDTSSVTFDAINGKLAFDKYAIYPILQKEVANDIYKKNRADFRQSVYGNSIFGTRKFSPLAIASSYGHTDIVKMLIDAGADLEAVAPSPLFFATLGGHREIAKELIDAGANVNNNKDMVLGDIFAKTVPSLSSSSTTQHRLALTPLLGAVLSEDLVLVQKLLQNGAYVNQPIIYLDENAASSDVSSQEYINNQLTVISIASLTANVAIVETLIRAGANANERYIYEVIQDDTNTTAVLSPLKLVELYSSIDGSLNADHENTISILCYAGAEAHRPATEVLKELFSTSKQRNFISRLIPGISLSQAKEASSEIKSTYTNRRISRKCNT